MKPWQYTGYSFKEALTWRVVNQTLFSATKWSYIPLYTRQRGAGSQSEHNRSSLPKVPYSLTNPSSTETVRQQHKTNINLNNPNRAQRNVTAPSSTFPRSSTVLQIYLVNRQRTLRALSPEPWALASAVPDWLVTPRQLCHQLPYNRDGGKLF